MTDDGMAAAQAAEEGAAFAASLAQLAQDSGLEALQWRGRTLLPVVQGGMGVGVSAGGLAGTVAGCGAVGTIASVDLRRVHPDLMERTGALEGPEAKGQIDEVNRVALALSLIHI